MKANAIIEKNAKGKYFAFMDNVSLEFGITGFGNTVEEAKSDFLMAYEEIKELFKDEGKPFPELEFEYKFDVASFLEHYSKVLSLAGLGRLTGVAQGQLSHYITGKRKPSQKTVEKIEKSLHNFAAEIFQVQLV